MQDNIAKISVLDVVGSPLCVASSDGHKIYQLIDEAIEASRPITLSFQGVLVLTSAFLNVAIGQLYGKFSSEQIRAVLQVADIEPEERALIKRVVKNAKQYFKDPAAFEQAIKEELGEDDV